jgi:zinc protease
MNPLLFTLALLSTVGAADADVSIPFTRHTLESNGLEIILSEDHALPVVAVNLWYHAGPINEEPGRTGFAHLFEHLMFQGSKNVGDDQHFKILSNAGASRINGTTSFDRTNYFETVPSNQLELALWLESDRMGFLLETLTLEKLDNQREVVKNERRQSVENRPYGPSGEKMFQTIFEKSHPYYGRIIGSMDDLNAASLDDVKNFYQSYYAPSNATIALVGDFDSAEALKLIKKYFGDLKRREKPAPKEIKTAPITAEKRVTVAEPVQLARMSMAWHSPVAYSQDDALCDLAAYILGHGKSSRLYQRLVYEKQIAQSVDVYQYSLTLQSLFAINVTAKAGVEMETIEKEIAAVINEFKNKGPTDREVERARNQLLTQMVSGLQQVNGRADLLNRYNQFTGDPGFFAKDLGRYKKASAKDVQELVKRLIKPESRVVILTVPKGEDAS